VPHLQGQGGHDEVFGEYMAEGTVSPLMMIRRGAYKFIYSEDDPCLLFDVHNDPRELEELSQSPQHRHCSTIFSPKRGPNGTSRRSTSRCSPASAAVVLSPMR
jgi:arylsulfatase A-like enzyme